MSAKDISRFLFQPQKRYSSVRMQQGRVILDSDWNESERIDDEEARRTRVETICSKGTPNQGFLVGDVTEATVTDPAGEGEFPPSFQTYDFRMAAGSFYLGGLRFEVLPEIEERFLSQTDWLQIDASLSHLPARPSVEELTNEDGKFKERYDLVYLRGWEQCVTAVEDSELRERALGGPDTSVRMRRMRRVEVLTAVSDCCTAAFAELKQQLTGEIAEFDNADFELLSKARLTVTFGDEGITEDPCKPKVTTGFLGAENQTISVQLTGSNRFIWGYDNASPLYRVQVLEEEGQLIKIEFLTLPRDQAAQPLKGQAVEILPWSAFLPNQEKVAELQGHLATVVTSYDPETKSITLSKPLPQEWVNWLNHPDHEKYLSEHDPEKRKKYFYLRLWTGGSGDSENPDHAFTSDSPIDLAGTGLKVSFSNFGLPGDFWIIAARPNTPHLVVPWELLDGAPPAGPRFFFAPLALIRWSADANGTVQPQVQDCRKTFRPLCEIGGCCKVTVGDGSRSHGDVTSIQQAVGLLPSLGGEVCVLPGLYEEHVVIEARQNITIRGCGRESRLQAQTGSDQPVLLVRNSLDITVSSLAFMATEGVAIELEGTYGPTNTVAPITGRLARVKLTDLDILARDRAAILGRSGRLVHVKGCRILLKPLVRALGEDPEIGRQAAVFLAGNDLLVEGNRIIATGDVQHTALGGLHIGGGSERVEIRRNVIEGGNGNGITLGSISFVPRENVNSFDFLVGHYANLSANPFFGTAIRVDENGCIRVDPNPPPPTDDVGPPLFPVSDGDLRDVRIVNNAITRMGASGISVVRFFDLAAPTPELITVDRLMIEGNHIHNCMGLELGDLTPPLHENAGFGGIALADGEYLIIRGNRIENNGTEFPDPICGVFILSGEGIAIEGNRILHNGRMADDKTMPRVGQRGGIVIGLARPRTMPLLTQIRRIGARQDGVPAIRVHDNIVVSPEGRALKILAIGPVSVEGNQFTAHGSNSLNLVPLPNSIIAGSRTSLLASAARVSFNQRLTTTNPYTAFLDTLGGAVVSIVNLGVSNEIYQQILGYSSLGLIDTLPGERENYFRLFAGGNILLNDNQIVLDALGPARTFSISSVLLFSLDDISMEGNQSDCDLAFDFVGTNALALGWSLRVADNRFKEGIQNALLSAFTSGVMNHTTNNQGTHCFLALGNLVEREHNQSLVSFFNEGACGQFERARVSLGARFGFMHQD